MAWIDTVPETQAADALAAAYARIRRERGKLSNIMRVQSLHAPAMEAHMDLYLALMFGRSGLRRAERELLAVVVSAANTCDYCVRHHAAALEAYWKDPARVERVMTDYRQADLPGRSRAMLAYAWKLTREPAAVREADVERLRAAGLSDRDILDVNLITSYFNFVNRIALGLGVEAAPDEVGGYRY